MPSSPRYGFDYLEVGETVPSEAVNEALERIEAGGGHFIFIDRDVLDPTALTPSPGDTYLIEGTGAGAWTGHDDEIAYRLNTAWEYFTPIEGFTAWVNDENAFIGFDGSAWNVLSAPSGAYLPLTGGTLSGDVIVPDEAYDATGWNGNNEAPTKNAIRDKIESLAGSIPGAYTDEMAQDAIGGILTDTGLAVVTYSDATPSIDVNVPAAAASDYRTGTDATKALTADAVWDAAVFVALTDGATVTPDFAAGINFTWTIGGNRTLANPSNAKEGQTGVIQVTQDGTGSRLISSYGANYRFAGGTDIVLSTAAGAIDLLFYQVLPSGLIFLTAQKAVAA